MKVMLPNKTGNKDWDIEILELDIEAHTGLSSSYATLSLLYPKESYYQVQLQLVGEQLKATREELERLLYERDEQEEVIL